MFRRVSILLCLLPITAAQATDSTGAAAPRPRVPPEAPPEFVHALFVCASGRSLRATFHNRPPANVMLHLSDGRRVRLWQALSGSGARYMSRDRAVVFWNKGTTGFLQENGAVTYRSCGQVLPIPARKLHKG